MLFVLIPNVSTHEKRGRCSLARYPRFVRVLVTNVNQFPGLRGSITCLGFWEAFHPTSMPLLSYSQSNEKIIRNYTDGVTVASVEAGPTHSALAPSSLFSIFNAPHEENRYQRSFDHPITECSVARWFRPSSIYRNIGMSLPVYDPPNFLHTRNRNLGFPKVNFKIHLLFRMQSTPPTPPNESIRQAKRSTKKCVD